MKIHFVTHSMGALVLRAFLQGHRPGNLGRVVMLAPPQPGKRTRGYFRPTRPLALVDGPWIVAETHDSITRSRPVFRSVLRFLETGAFGQGI